MNQAHKISLDGITLEMMLNRLVVVYGWKELGKLVTIKCFTNDPSIKSSLHFLRRTPWARKKVEALFLKLTKTIARKKAKAAKPADPGK